MNSEKKRLTSAVDVLQSLFEKGNSGLSGQYCCWKLAQKWEEVAGETVAANCKPDKYIKGTLYLAVIHPVWLQQIKFMEKEILKNVNEFVGKPWATEIKCFVTGREIQSR